MACASASSRIRQDIKQHHQKHERVARQNADVPDLMVAKMRRERIRLPAPEDHRADRVAESAREKQGHGFRAELFIDGTDQKNDDPAHQQETDIRQPDRDFGKENRLERDEENRQAPDDPK